MTRNKALEGLSNQPDAQRLIWMRFLVKTTEENER
jgi:hypothetical protein